MGSTDVPQADRSTPVADARARIFKQVRAQERLFCGGSESGIQFGKTWSSFLGELCVSRPGNSLARRAATVLRDFAFPAAVLLMIPVGFLTESAGLPGSSMAVAMAVPVVVAIALVVALSRVVRAGRYFSEYVATWALSSTFQDLLERSAKLPTELREDVLDVGRGLYDLLAQVDAAADAAGTVRPWSQEVAGPDESLIARRDALVDEAIDVVAVVMAAVWAHERRDAGSSAGKTVPAVTVPSGNQERMCAALGRLTAHTAQ